MNPSSTPRKSGGSSTASNDPSPASNATGGTNRWTDAALCGWFVLVGIAFWVPYAGIDLPFNVLTALYAAFLLLFIAAAALRFLRNHEDREPVTATAKGERRGK